MQIAYLDPGSGSIIASLLVGGVAGVGVAARSARARLGGAFRKKQDVDSPESTESNETDEDITVETDV